MGDLTDDYYILYDKILTIARICCLWYSKNKTDKTTERDVIHANEKKAKLVKSGYRSSLRKCGADGGNW